ncbi:GDP-fucose synthetase [Rhodothalassium salexigens]|uniref:GDP-L-fucose synthase n=1 Tax=Rhodothalassium salexigens TaxID=1086 RepID=UPI00237AFF94|nr:GDP-L-fucose synthase [Rhodothalassium salexigens]MBK5910391.1 GDP-fucose synthetase [Rhodothalassium salexigens]MBK5920864.1 GDP-fucose synthetase [Rhodothalassium salexigens]
MTDAAPQAAARQATTTAPVTYDLTGARVFVAGHRGMVGSALCRRLAREPVTVLTAPRDAVDLRDQAAVAAWFAEARPDAVFLAAAKVGGILANDHSPADFLYDNLMIEANLIHAAHQTGVAKLLFLGSSCIYPKHATQPMDEAQLLTGPLEPTNEWYAIAKIAGIKLCQAYARQHGRRFISAMPTNLYGPGDTYDLETSHVIPALIRKMHEARVTGAPAVTLWGSGRPRREFLYVDDLADALVFLMRHYEAPEHVNVGWGEDVTIAEVAERIAAAVGFAGRFDYDTSKPDGTPRKLLDTSRLNALGWRPGVTLDDGLARTYRAFLADHG